MNLRSCHSVMVLLTIGIFSVPVLAIMQLVPPIQEVEIQRGQRGSFSVTITNTGDEDVPCRFSAHDLDMSSDGVPFISDSGVTRGCGSWITLDPPDAVIKAHETLVLKAMVAVPSSAEGGYYALIKGAFTETTIPLSGEEVNIQGSQIGLESQAVVAVLLTVPSSRCRPVIVPDTLLVFPRGEDTSSVSFQAGERKGWKVVMPIRNDGKLHTRLSGTASFWSESGVRLESAPLEAGRGYLLPGKTRKFTALGENVLADGSYMIRIALQTTEGQNMSQSFPFAVYDGQFRPGEASEQLLELIRASSPGFALREPFVQRTVTPGGFSYLTIQMMSTVNDTVVLVPRKAEWGLDANGQPAIMSADSIRPGSCTQWMELPEERLVLLPGRNSVFKLKVNAPADITGEHFAAIIFDSDRPRPDLPAEFMAGRTQLIALASPQGMIYDARVDTVMVKKERLKERDLSLYRFLFVVTNTGNAHCFAAGNMSLEKEVAEEMYKPVGAAQSFGSAQTYLLPGSRRAFEIDLPNLEPGQYRVTVAVTFKDGAQPAMRYERIKLN